MDSDEVCMPIQAAFDPFLDLNMLSYKDWIGMQCEWSRGRRVRLKHRTRLQEPG